MSGNTSGKGDASASNDNIDKTLMDRFNVAVFAASSMMKDPGHAEDAAYVGNALGELGYTLLYGGGDMGLMGVVSGAALNAGGSIKGYTMKCFQQAGDFPQKDFEEISHTIADRKQTMLLYADAYIALGGGFGTLDEIVEAGTEQYLAGYMDPPLPVKPIILINRNGLYDPFMAQLDKFIEEGSVRAEVKDFFTLVKDGREAIEALQALRTAPQKEAVPIGNVGIDIEKLRGMGPHGP